MSLLITKLPWKWVRFLDRSPKYTRWN